MSREHRDPRKRADGTDIDPVKDLGGWLQSFPPDAEPEPPEPKPAPKKAAAPEAEPPKQAEPPAPVTPARAPVSEPPAPAPPAEDEVTKLRRERDEAKAEAARLAQQRQIDEAAQRAVQRHIPAPPPTEPAPAPPSVDSMWAEYEQVQFTDPPKARQLLATIQDRKIEEARNRWREEQQLANGQAQGRYAYEAAMTALRAQGVPDAELNDPDRITALYTMVTRPSTPQMPNPFAERGGPRSADVLLEAAKKVFSFPQKPPAPVFEAPVAEPPAATPAPPPRPVVAPPGSNRPAPAAAPQTTRTTPLPAGERRDIDYIASQFKMDPEKLAARRRQRIEEEG